MVSPADEGASKTTGYMTFRVRKQPWYVWLLRAAWIGWLIMWLEFAVGSRQEGEREAFRIAVEVLIVSVMLGLALYFWKLRESRAKKATGHATSS